MQRRSGHGRPQCARETRETPGGSGESGRMGAPHAMPKGDEPAAIDVGSIEAATGRLIAALDALEAAAERRHDAEAVRRRQLEATSREIARRLDLAIEGVRSVLESHDR